MKLNIMKKVFAFALGGIICFSASGVKDTYARNDIEASTYGFVVDNDDYYKTVWYNTITTKVEFDGHIIGTCTTNIGATRAKSKTSGNKYLDQIMILCAMKGKHPATNYAGYSEHLTIESKIPYGMELAAYSPESEVKMQSYDIGLDVSTDKTVGISASTTVTKKALEINCYSDKNSRLFKECYDYIHSDLRWNWDVYSTYAYRESLQRAHYTIKTSNSKYNTYIVVKPKFQRWDDEPGYWANQYNHYSTVEHTIYFTTPY